MQGIQSYMRMSSEIQFCNLKPQQICDRYFLSTVLLKEWWKGINVLLKKKNAVSAFVPIQDPF